LLLFDTAVVGCTVHYFYLFFRDPIYFYCLNRADLQPISTLTRILRWPYALLVIIGIGVCLYRFGLFAFAWMPGTWKVFDQMNDQSAAQFLALIFALGSGVALLGGMSTLSRRLSREQKNSN
jgi:hypothetical protein